MEKNRRRYAIAFQQRQQKQFTYSVSYFNWAVSDEEEEDEEFSHELSSSSTPRHNRSSTSGFEKNSHNGSKHGFLYQQRKCNKTIKKWAMFGIIGGDTLSAPCKVTVNFFQF